MLILERLIKTLYETTCVVWMIELDIILDKKNIILALRSSLSRGSTFATNGSSGWFWESTSIPKAVEAMASMVKCL